VFVANLQFSRRAPVLSAAVVAIIDGETHYAKNALFFSFPRCPLKL